MRAAPELKGGHTEGAGDHAPPLPRPIAIKRIQLGVSVDELLYRYDMGDIAGALSVGLPCSMKSHPGGHHARRHVGGRQRVGSEEYVLSLVDGWSTMNEIVQASHLSTLDTLRTFCELIEKGVIALH